MQTTGARTSKGWVLALLASLFPCVGGCADSDGALRDDTTDASLRAASAFSIEPVETPAPCEGAVLVAAPDRDEFVLVGGVMPGTPRLCATTWIYAVRTGRWSRIGAAIARTDHAAVVVGDSCFVVGGRDESGAPGGIIQLSLAARSIVSTDRSHVVGLVREQSAAPLHGAWLVAGGTDVDDREHGDVLRVELPGLRTTALSTPRGLRARTRPLLAADEFGIAMWGGASETAGPDWLDGAWWPGTGSTGRRIATTGLPAGGSAQSAAWVAGRLWVAAAGRLHAWSPDRPLWHSVGIAVRDGSTFAALGSDLLLVGAGVADVVDAQGRFRTRLAGPNLERVDMLVAGTRAALVAIHGRVGRMTVAGGVLIRRLVGRGR